LRRKQKIKQKESRKKEERERKRERAKEENTKLFKIWLFNDINDIKNYIAIKII